VGIRPVIGLCQSNSTRTPSLVPQVRVLPLDANPSIGLGQALGRERFGTARRTFSILDLGLSTPIRSLPVPFPGTHNAGNCSTSNLPLLSLAMRAPVVTAGFLAVAAHLHIAPAAAAIAALVEKQPGAIRRFAHAYGVELR
jgi:hypothetical protein